MNAEQIRQSIEETNEDLPGEWVTGIGEGGKETYTNWYYHNDWELQVFSDPGQPHTVALYEVREDVEYEDQKVAEYPTETDSFKTEEEAFDHAMELMEKYND